MFMKLVNQFNFKAEQIVHHKRKNEKVNSWTKH